MNSSAITEYQKRVAANMVDRLFDRQWRPNVFDSPEQLKELVGASLARGINPAAQRIIALMEDRSGEGNDYGANQFTEGYLEGAAALGCNVLQIVPPRPGEPNSVEILKSGIIRIRYLPTSTEGRDFANIQKEFALAGSSILQDVAEKRLLGKILSLEELKSGNFSKIEGRVSYALIETAYLATGTAGRDAAARQQVGGPGMSLFVYHPHADKKEIDPTTGMSPYEDVLFGVGEHNGVALTISSTSKQAFERLLARGSERGVGGKQPRVLIKPAGSTASLPDIDPLSIDSQYKDGRINIAYMGRLAKEKGPEDAIAAYRAVLDGWKHLDQLRRPRLILMGGPTRGQEALRGQVEAANADLIENGDLVIAGRVSDTFKNETFVMSDALLVTSLAEQESWHLASDEARFYECLPFALTRCGGIQDGQRIGGGVEIDVDSPKVLGEALVQYLTRKHGLEAPDSTVNFELRTNGKVSRLYVSQAEGKGLTSDLDTYVDLPVENRFGLAHVPWAAAALKLLTEITPLRDIQLSLT